MDKDALKSPAVDLPHLAEKVEKAHLTAPPSTCDVVAATKTGYILYMYFHNFCI